MSSVPSRLDDLRNLRRANLDVAFAMGFVALSTGMFLVGFVQFLGGSDIWIGILTALPALLGLLQIPGAIWGRSKSYYKAFVLPGGLIWRLFHLPLLAIPFLPIPAEAKLTILFVSLALAYAGQQLCNPIYSDWIAEMVPSNARGWYFSRRGAIAAAVSASVGMLGAVVLDRMKSAGQPSVGYLSVFSIAMVSGGISFYFFATMQDRVRAHPVSTPIKKAMGAMAIPFRDRHFRSVLVFLGVATIAQAFGGNLFAAFALESLKMPFSVLQMAIVAHAVGTVASARIWGFLADRYGNKPILAILVLGLSLTPIMWLLCVPGAEVRNAVILISGHIFTGVVWGGIAVTQFNLLLATAHPDDRANYIGAGMALQSLVGAASPLTGAFLMQMLRAPMGPETAYKMVFGVTIVLRLISLGFLLPVREDGSFSISGTLRQLRRVTPKGFRAMRDLSGASDAGVRESAIADAASSQFEMAADEIEKALHDPAPRVRRQAASALAQVGGDSAASALAHQLMEHPDLVEEETLETLAIIGRPEDVPALIPYLQSLRPLLRRAAARALGRIGGDLATPALIAAVHDQPDPDLRRSALQALRNLNSREAVGVICEALTDPHPSVRIAAAEAIVELDFPEAAPALRAAILQYQDEASSEAAYALGCVGTELDDLGLILDEAKLSRSVITRRRALLGAARRLGVESEVYRLMMRDGMARDTNLMDALRPAVKRQPALAEALQRYSGGDEAGAAAVLAERAQAPGARVVALSGVEDAFLIAALHERDYHTR